LGEVAERSIALRVAALVWTLQLDEEALAAERMREPGSGVRIAHAEPVACTAGETDEPFVQLLEQVLVEARRQRLPVLFRPRARVRMREQPAKICVPLRRLDEQRDMGSAAERELGS